MTDNPNFLVINQAIVDTSLEIKSALETFQRISMPENRSKMNIKISLETPKITDIESQDDHELKEVSICYIIEGSLEKELIFIVQVIHSTLIKCINVNSEQKDFFLNKEYPISITPYIYSAAIDVLQVAGLSGISIPPIELVNFEAATVIGHHAKDISFQTNCSPATLAEIRQDYHEKRNVGVDFNIGSRVNKIDSQSLLGEDLDIVEIEIASEIRAKYKDKPLCTCEILYSVIVKINDMEDEMKKRFLSFDCPRLFFPFIIALTNKSFMDAGLGKINIPPLDFARLIVNANRKSENQ